MEKVIGEKGPERGGKERRPLRYSVQTAFILIYCAFLLGSIALLNTYPTLTSRDVVFSAKQSALTNQATITSVSLSALERLSAEGVEQVMAILDVGEFDRVIVVDRDAGVLYDTDTLQSTVGETCDFAQVTEALTGLVSGDCVYDTAAFESRIAVPVMSYGSVIGAVYLYERDTQQAQLINSIQTQLRSISLVSGAVTLAVVILLTRMLTRRLRTLAEAMQVVREGDYQTRVKVRGRDELSDLSAAFNEMTSRLQSTEELRRRFVSDASHELRTPLASIRLLSDSVVQSEHMDAETMREFVMDIGAEADRLQRMTEKLMRLTRRDSRVPLERRPVEVKAVAERTVRLLAPLAEQRSVTVSADLAAELWIAAAEDDLFQILFNLMENAVKYNCEGGTVLLRLAAEGDMAVLTVEDTGIGIPEKDLPHIFSRFYRVDKARSREAGGSGLGLSIVHDAVESNGGTIEVQRRKTIGTRMIVRFPLLPGSAAEYGGAEV